MRNNAHVVMLMGMVLALGLAAPASADLLTFSGELTDNDAPIDVFNATIDYRFDSTTNVLTIELANLTQTPAAYTLSELFFNVSDDVWGLSILDAGGFARPGVFRWGHAGGFGWFDYVFDLQTNGPGGANAGLGAGQSSTFTFQAYGVGLDITDFFTGYQVGGGKDKGDAVSALKFTQGPGGDSVYAIPGGVVPEPSSLVLLGLGLAGFAARKKMRS